MPHLPPWLRTAVVAVVLPLCCGVAGVVAARAPWHAAAAPTLVRAAHRAPAPTLPTGEWSQFTRYLDPVDPGLLAWEQSTAWRQRCDIWTCNASLVKREAIPLEPLLQLQLDRARRIQFSHAASAASLHSTSQVFYSAAAYDLLKAQGIGFTPYWNGQLLHPAAASPFVTTQPQPPTVVKEEFQVLRLSDNACTAGCLKRVAVYDPAVAPDQQIEGTPRDSWQSSVQVDLNLSHPCPTPTLAGFPVAPLIATAPPDPHPAGTVPLRCFHFQVTHGATIIAASAIRQSDLNSGARVYLLLGFHMMRADKPLWSWDTFWWSPRPLDVTHGCTMPAPTDVPALAPWRFYCLDTIDTDNEVTRQQPHRDPYLEGSMTNGLTTNCIFCHSRALYHPGQGVDADFAEGHAPPDPKQPFTRCPLPGAAPSPGSPACPAHTVPTDFLWSVALHVDTPGAAFRKQ